jgi:hypothetical protein
VSHAPLDVDQTIARMKEAWRTCSWRTHRFPGDTDGMTHGEPRWAATAAALRRIGDGSDPDGDRELLAFVAIVLDPERCAQAKKKARASARRDREDEAWEAQGIDLGDVSYRGKAALERAARGMPVWLYHGTSSKQLPGIRRHGLRIGDAKVDPAETPGVYLTARLGGGGYHSSDAQMYADRAARTLGGDPVVLRVLVPFDDLSWDSDDEDIATGAYQFVTDSVPPEQILEINGVRQKPAKAKRTKNPAEDDWGSSNEASSAITGESARLLGLDGYRRGRGARDAATAARFLNRAWGERTTRVLYSGHAFSAARFHALKAGSEISLPLTATSPDKDFARSFADGRAAVPVLFRVSKGAPGFRYSEAEWIIAGTFRVTSLKRTRDPFWKTDLWVATLVHEEHQPSSRRPNPAFSLEEALSRGYRVTVTTSRLPAPEDSGLRDRDRIVAEIAAPRPGGAPTVLASVTASRWDGWPYFEVVRSLAERGWGPLAYDLAMEQATELGSSLVPDTHTVSDAARAVWGTYATRPDVQRAPKGGVVRFPGDQYAYRKRPALLPRVRRAGRPQQGTLSP